MALRRFPPPSWASVRRRFVEDEIEPRIMVLGQMHGWDGTEEWRHISQGFKRIRHLLRLRTSSTGHRCGLWPRDLNRSFAAYLMLLEIEEQRHDEIIRKVPCRRQYVRVDGVQRLETFDEVLRRYDAREVA
jgi:hypothetical protein